MYGRQLDYIQDVFLWIERAFFYAPAKEGTAEERTLMRENVFASPS